MSNSDHSNETKSSIGKNSIVGGVDLCAEISNVLKSMMPSIEKKTLKKIKESRGKETLMSLSRDQFKKLVFRTNILESQKHRLEEFNHVDQEYENVHDYTVKFYKYVRFGTINEATEKKKIERGLKTFIRGRVIKTNPKTFEEVVRQA
ncbi:hypothetical protein Tco_0462816 [Tanacetum coccineum]